MMRPDYDILFSLLRAEINCKYDNLPRLIDWEAVFVLATKHGVGALAWDGLMKLYKDGVVSSEQLPTSAVKLRWIGIVQRTERNNALQQRAMLALDPLLGQKDLNMLVFKGMSLSLYFPIPNHRECCDVDAYALNSKYKEMLQCFEVAGAIAGDKNKKHSTTDYRSVHFELHSSFVYRTCSCKVKRMNDELISMLVDAEKLLDYNSIYKPSTKFDSLFVLIHAANHYKTEGMAIRHVVDWALVLKSCDYKWNEEWLRKYGLLPFARILNRIARECLGFDIPVNLCTCDDEIYQRVLNDILYPQYEAGRNVSKGNLLVRKYKRFTSRKWVYPLVGDNFWKATFSTIVAHILDPVSIFRGNK